MPNPSVPAAVNPLQPSASFRKEAIKAIFAIIAFVVVYLLLFVLAILLAAACMYFGIQLIINIPKWLTIVIGVGLIGVGIMVFVFLIKFLFESTKQDLSGSIEITEHEQPRLVSFIHSIAKETRTSRPKKIFISHDVNACVFYNSSFWSMFLPVKKNLMIGLGLVNALNVSEFKAVVAHEFGHFSQRSMKLGSFVYNVNHIIFNMLYKNNSYGKTLQGWANLDGVFYFFAKLTASIVQGIQYILRQMYKVVNLSYMGLSREMEFHADLVASSVSGSNNIISSLKRIEVADSCLNATLATYDKLLKEDKRSTNMYDDHRSVLHHFATANNYHLEDGLPVLSNDFDNSADQRVNVKNQWASHPSTKERKEYLDKYDLSGDVDATPAWSLLDNATELKEQFTNQIYAHIEGLQTKVAIDNSSFNSFYGEQIQSATLPAVFGDYYDNRIIETFDLDEALNMQPAISYEAIFNEDVQRLPKAIQAVNTDLLLLKAIESGEVDTSTFDFNGSKYKKQDAPVINVQLEKELNDMNELLKKADQELFAFFHYKAAQQSPEQALAFKNRFKEYFTLQIETGNYLILLQKILEILQPIYGGAMENERISILIYNMKQEEEKLKTGLKQWIEYGAFDVNPKLKEKAAELIEKNYAYFSGTSYFDNELQQLNEVIHEGWAEINKFLFEKYKGLVEMESGLVG